MVKIDREGRDNGKAFLITEMSPMSQLDWGASAALIMVNAGVTLPDGAGEMGFAGLFGVDMSNLRNSIKWEELKPLVDDLMGCVKCVPNPSDPDTSRMVIDSDIEEVSTLLTLQSEVFRLHVNFT